MPRGDVDSNNNNNDNNNDNKDNNDSNNNNNNNSNDNKDNNDGNDNNDNNEGYKNDKNDDDSSAEKQSRKHLFLCRIHIFSTRPFLKRPNSFFEVAAEEKKDNFLIFSLGSKTGEVVGSNPAKCWTFFFFLYSLRNRV